MMQRTWKQSPAWTRGKRILQPPIPKSSRSEIMSAAGLEAAIEEGASWSSYGSHFDLSTTSLWYSLHSLLSAGKVVPSFVWVYQQCGHKTAGKRAEALTALSSLGRLSILNLCHRYFLQFKCPASIIDTCSSGLEKIFYSEWQSNVVLGCKVECSPGLITR